MSGVDQRNKRKRLECLKKKSKELSILCDVEVLFHYKEGKRKERTDDDQAIFTKKKKLYKSEMGFLKQSDGLQLQMGFEKDEKFEMDFLEESDGFCMGFEKDEKFKMDFLEESDGFCMGFVDGEMGFFESQGFQMDGEGFDVASLEES
ncbi:hypothetical protein LWI28_025349 [Acer negundo]|uniref:MADS-box domain-containing protein n=1 Tax=Acer negundo TaxID=4023 RepID=A0AAD5INQ9_ACENE|nr:hypothetical protein LWI28_025349 [Acer negundo]